MSTSSRKERSQSDKMSHLYSILPVAVVRNRLFIVRSDSSAPVVSVDTKVEVEWASDKRVIAKIMEVLDKHSSEGGNEAEVVDLIARSLYRELWRIVRFHDRQMRVNYRLEQLRIRLGLNSALECPSSKTPMCQWNDTGTQGKEEEEEGKEEDDKEEEEEEEEQEEEQARQQSYCYHCHQQTFNVQHKHYKVTEGAVASNKPLLSQYYASFNSVDIDISKFQHHYSTCTTNEATPTTPTTLKYRPFSPVSGQLQQCTENSLSLVTPTADATTTQQSIYWDLQLKFPSATSSGTKSAQSLNTFEFAGMYWCAAVSLHRHNDYPLSVTTIDNTIINSSHTTTADITPTSTSTSNTTTHAFLLCELNPAQPLLAGETIPLEARFSATSAFVNTTAAATTTTAGDDRDTPPSVVQHMRFVGNPTSPAARSKSSCRINSGYNNRSNNNNNNTLSLEVPLLLYPNCRFFSFSLKLSLSTDRCSSQ